MKLQLTVVGKTSTSWLREGIDEYVGRIVRLTPFEMVTLPDLRNTRNLTPERQKLLEGQSILASITDADTLILLDERGRRLTSRGFAEFIEKRTASGGQGRLVFVIGGPYGFSPEVYARANYQIALSEMTFTHEMARLVMVEQLYRALAIINHLPYHHD